MSPWGADKPWHPFEPAAWSQLVAIFPYTEVLFEPGTQYRYSNPGSILLGRIRRVRGTAVFVSERCDRRSAVIRTTRRAET